VTIPGVDEEEAVLGAILTKGEAYQEAASYLRENDFYKEEHRLVWRAMTSLNNQGKKIDAVSVCTVLKEKRCLTKAGGTSSITSLMDILFDVGNVKLYAEGVNSAARGRELKRTGRKLMNEDIPAHQRLDVAYAELTEINKRSEYGKTVRIGDVSDEIVSTVVGGNGFSGGVRMGFHALDDPLNGLSPGDYAILGAEPSTGKSAFALQVAAAVAKKNIQVLYISPEMSKLQLGFRMLSVESGVPYKDIVRGTNLKSDDEDAIAAAGDMIKLLPITVDDSSEQSVANIRLKARRCLGEPLGLGLIVVDYLQMLCPGDDDKAAVTVVTKGLKAITKDLEVPMLACSQLRRKYGQEVRKPDKSRLKGSGQLEADADIVLLMWYPDAENNKRLEVFIDKNRNGPLGQTMLAFDSKTTRFTETEVW
jgi:replicative DNA helicase